MSGLHGVDNCQWWINSQTVETFSGENIGKDTTEMLIGCSVLSPEFL